MELKQLQDQVDKMDTKAMVLSLAIKLEMVSERVTQDFWRGFSERGVLLYFWFHVYSKVEMWYNKKIGSLPERVSAPDRFVFFLFSTTMRSPFKKENPSVGTS